MSLRKSPTLTPALLAANRRNAKRSTGPRTARGKAVSRLNRMKDGMRSPEYLKFVKAVMDAPPGRVGQTALDLLSSQQVIHPLFMDMAKMIVHADFEISDGHQWRREHEK